MLTGVSGLALLIVKGEEYMKKRTLCLILTLGAMLMLMLTGCGKESTFAAITDVEVFASVPLMSNASGEEYEFSEVEDCGDGDSRITAYNTTLDDYDRYRSVLEENGFTLFTDNGDEGIEGYIYSANYLKENFLVKVTHLTKTQETIITVNEDALLSENLNYKDEYVANNIEGAKTTLTMNEIYHAGNCFVFQLKNGHFIINDGGQEENLPYLLDFLDSRVPEGEKPVVDVWIVSHLHTDHIGVFIPFTENKSYCDRLYVNSIYHTAPNDQFFTDQGASDSMSALDFYVNAMPSYLTTEDGGKPPVYRMRLGETYYFNDITMDVIYTPDLFDYNLWKTSNSSCTVLMYHIEGQKVMMTADTDFECQARLLELFDDEYFDLDVYQAPHHGGNVYNEISSHYTIKTVLIPSPKVTRPISSLLGRYMQHEYLKSRALETAQWGDGGVVLTFPYEVGTYEKLPQIEWIYNQSILDILD